MRSFEKTSVLCAVLVSGLLVLLPAHGGAATRNVVVSVIAVIAHDDFTIEFKEPSALFFDEAKKRFYVADSGNRRLVSYDSDFDLLAELAHSDMLLPTSLVKTKAGVFYVTDSASGDVKLVDPGKELVESLALKGVPPAAHDILPGRLAIDGSENLYVVDRLNRRVLVVDGKGRFLRELKAKEGEASAFSDVRVRGSEVYVLDSVKGKVFVFNGKGEVVSSFGGRGEKGAALRFATSLAVGPGGLIYVLDSHAVDIKVFDKFGAFQYTLSRGGFDVGELYHPTYIYIDMSGRIFILDGTRVQVFKEVRE